MVMFSYPHPSSAAAVTGTGASPKVATGATGVQGARASRPCGRWFGSDSQSPNRRDAFSPCSLQRSERRPTRAARIFAVLGLLLFPVIEGRGDIPPAPVQARYVRVDAPTSPIMGWQEIEVMGGGKNLVLRRPELLTGSSKDAAQPFDLGGFFTNAEKDTKVRGKVVESAGPGAWMEIDLGQEVLIDEILLYGSRYPHREYQDTGHRVLSLLDANRHVIWAARWNYHDEKQFPGGAFKFFPGKGGPPAPLVGGVSEANRPLRVPINWLVDVAQEKLSADSADRMRRFEERNSPEAIKALADEFFNLLEPGVEGLAGARRLHAEGRNEEALDAWKRFFFEKMARVKTHLTPFAGLISNRYSGEGDDLLQGLKLSTDATKATKFTPGRIFWVDTPADDRDQQRVIEETSNLAFVGSFAEGLLARFNETGDAKYLRAWSEIMDDWSLNFFRDADASEYNVKNLFVMHPGDRWADLMEDLSDLADRYPQAVEEIPAPTLARMQLACLKEYPPAYWRLARETVFNHNTSGLQRWACTVPYIDEFRPATRLARECRRHMERWMTLGTQADGSMAEMGDEGHFYIPLVLGGVFNIWSAQNPDWLTPGWKNRFLDYYDTTIEYFFRHPMPGGYDHRFEYRLRPSRFYGNAEAEASRDGMSPALHLDRSATTHAIPEVRRIIDTVFSVSDGLPGIDSKAPVHERQKLAEKMTNRQEALKLLGNDRPGTPRINSDWMPYTGSYLFRRGWREGDAFLSMFARGSKGGGHAEQPSWSHGLVYGFDYNYPLFRAETPLINGTRQNMMGDRYPGFMPGGKTSNICFAEREPAPNRWHSSDRFDFGEAVYEGIYQNVSVAPWKLLYSREPSFGPKIENARSNRQVFQVRSARLFVFADTIHFKDAQAKDNAFEVPLALMLSTAKLGATALFSKDQSKIDAPAKSVATQNPDGANVILRQFGDFALDYSAPNTGDPDFRSHVWALPNAGIARQEITSRWRARGDTALVTLVSTSPPKGTENVVSVTPRNAGPSVAGFEARMKDGVTVWFQCAATIADLACGPVQASAQTLLVEKRADGSVSGLALGVSSMKVGGKIVKKAPADFEFSVHAKGKVATQEIHRPISTVRFHPDINTFEKELQVELTCATPGVQIRYTTDGTQPTPDSPLYKKPLTITESTEFAARAYRLGRDGKPLAADPFEINGTKFTETSYGWFYKKPLQAAAGLDKAALVPGLLCEHLEGHWSELYSAAHWMPAVKTSTAEREMDLSQVKSEDTYYGARFKGFIEIPAEGVYTFRAPNEIVYPESAASYDLRLFINGLEWEPTEWWHGRGTWSVPLAKGLHRFQVDFAEARTKPWRKSDLWRNYPLPWSVYQGDPSPLLVSGPDLKEQRIPKDWFFHEAGSTTAAP